MPDILCPSQRLAANVLLFMDSIDEPRDNEFSLLKTGSIFFFFRLMALQGRIYTCTSHSGFSHSFLDFSRFCVDRWSNPIISVWSGTGILTRCCVSSISSSPNVQLLYFTSCQAAQACSRDVARLPKLGTRISRVISVRFGDQVVQLTSFNLLRAVIRCERHFKKHSLQNT
jgi:hypothetical protein